MLRRAQAFRKALVKRSKGTKERAAWKRSREIYRALAPAFDIAPAAVSRIWLDNADAEYEEVFKEKYDLWEYSVYPRLLVRNTIMKWLIGSENIIETAVWKYLVKASREAAAPKIIFQTKPKDIWVLMLTDISHVATLNPQIVIPTSEDGLNAVILSLSVFLKERQHG